MKKIIALCFNLLVASVITAAMGAPAIVGLGAGLLTGILPGVPQGSFGMAIQKEVWMSSIIEGLFADNTFLSLLIGKKSMKVLFLSIKSACSPINSGASSS